MFRKWIGALRNGRMRTGPPSHHVCRGNSALELFPRRCLRLITPWNALQTLNKRRKYRNGSPDMSTQKQSMEMIRNYAPPEFKTNRRKRKRETRGRLKRGYKMICSTALKRYLILDVRTKQKKKWRNHRRDEEQMKWKGTPCSEQFLILIAQVGGTCQISSKLAGGRNTFGGTQSCGDACQQLGIKIEAIRWSNTEDWDFSRTLMLLAICLWWCLPRPTVQRCRCCICRLLNSQISGA